MKSMVEKVEYRVMKVPIGRGGWRRLFDRLPVLEPVIFRCASREEAHQIGISFGGILRRSRIRAYRVYYRVIPNRHEACLCAWKEAT